MSGLPRDFYRSLVENAKNVVWVISRDEDRVIFVNRDFCGLSREKLYNEGISAAWLHLGVDELEPLLRAIETASMRGEPTENIQAVHRNFLTGEEECYLHSVYPLHDSEREVTHIQVTSREITPLLRTQRTLEILSTVNGTVQDNMLAGHLFKIVGRRLAGHGLYVVIFNFQDTKMLRLEYANFPNRKLKKFMSMLGIGGPPYEFPFERFPTAKKAMTRKKALFFESSYDYLKSRILKGEAVKRIGELSQMLGDGKIIIAPMMVNRRSIGVFFMISDSLSRMDLRTVNALAVQFAHVIVHRQIFNDVRKLREHLETLLENVEEAVFTTDLQGVIVSWNRAARELLGHDRKDIIGKRVTSLGVGEGIWNTLRETCKKGKAGHSEKVSLLCLKGGRKATAITTFPTDEEGRDPGVVFVVRELTPAT